MTNDVKHWNPREDADRQAFMALLLPLVIASRTREFDAAGNDRASRHEVQTRLTTWMVAFGDVPRDVLEQAVTRKLGQGVRHYMPSHEDIRVLCCDVVDESRKLAARQAKALAEDCPDCDGSQWVRPVIDGVDHVARCRCFTRGIALIEGAGSALSRPQLTAARESIDGEAPS